ncbi:MAG: Mg-protoporphyrin IX methyl transferase [Syntrophus sp. PtaB.Bin001]|jgi:SAM-dependent methyltransferase|nr:MAG: Mg-protoporphyrin IX methyl transferase [Syntrophus sp. PtaB.Bin001]
MQPLINWEELQAITRPPMKHPPDKDAGWERNFAVFYNKVASMEKLHTLNQVNALPLLPDDTLLDVGCGPGRLSVPLAQRVKSVTSLDVSEEVLKYCRMNADAAGLTNLTTKKLDFKDAVPGENIEKHDVAICSRSVGLHDLKKLSSLADRLTAIVSFANAPTIPHLLSNIFKGTAAENGKRPPFTAYGMDRRLNYNILYNIAYDLGYEPNVKVVEDGFVKDYATKEEAYEDIVTLGKVDEDKTDIFRSNLDRYLTKNDKGGFTFFIETRTCVIWWEKNPKKFF